MIPWLREHSHVCNSKLEEGNEVCLSVCLYQFVCRYVCEDVAPIGLKCLFFLFLMHVCRICTHFLNLRRKICITFTFQSLGMWLLCVFNENCLSFLSPFIFLVCSYGRKPYAFGTDNYRIYFFVWAIPLKNFHIFQITHTHRHIYIYIYIY